MKYQYQIVASNYELETISLFFDNKHVGWITLPKSESGNFIKILRARHKSITITYVK